ncbi:MAG: ABC transporter ATP-binding protein [Clostridia bacterium]|jgi:ATP-binding cassette subfamily B protein|nr:ABC transporter ATP-binding protein [Clostridia bacterium]
MKKIFPFLKPYKNQLILTGALCLLFTLGGAFLPYLMSRIVDDGIAVGDMGVILKLGGLMLGLAVVSMLGAIWMGAVNAKVSAGFSHDLTRSIFDKASALDFENFSKIGTSGLLTRSTHDVSTISGASSMFVNVVVVVPILLAGGVAFAFLSDRVLALILLASMPVAFLILFPIVRHLDRLWKLSDEYIDVQNRLMRERLSGIRVIRAFDKEAHEHGRIAHATEEMAKYIIRANVRAGYVNPLCMLVLNLATVVMLLVGANRLQNPELMNAGLTAGGIIATVQYVALILNGVMMLSWTFVFLPHLKVCVNRVTEVLELPDEPAEAGDGTILGGDLVLEDVGFAYPGSELKTVSNVNITIKAGETAALIGGTGSGKSTILKLLLDFYAPTEGRISLGGKPYDEIGRGGVRENISAALQKGMVFEGTLLDNVRMGNPDADEDAVKNVLDIAQMTEFTESHEEGLEYRLAQSGANISGGQKQRISIARTILKPASVYVFDDSFSALDFLTESKLRKALNRYLAGKTQIIITQRAATAMRCDVIFVIEQGSIVGTGTHAELLKTCEVYREIVRSQLGGDAV